MRSLKDREKRGDARLGGNPPDDVARTPEHAGLATGRERSDKAKEQMPDTPGVTGATRRGSRDFPPLEKRQTIFCLTLSIVIYLIYYANWHHPYLHSKKRVLYYSMEKAKIAPEVLGTDEQKTPESAKFSLDEVRKMVKNDMQCAILLLDAIYRDQPTMDMLADYIYGRFQNAKHKEDLAKQTKLGL